MYTECIALQDGPICCFRHGCVLIQTVYMFTSLHYYMKPSTCNCFVMTPCVVFLLFHDITVNALKPYMLVSDRVLMYIPIYSKHLLNGAVYYIM